MKLETALPASNLKLVGARIPPGISIEDRFAGGRTRIPASETASYVRCAGLSRTGF
jgi:hypothetical protein